MVDLENSFVGVGLSPTPEGNSIYLHFDNTENSILLFTWHIFDQILAKAIRLSAAITMNRIVLYLARKATSDPFKATIK